MSDYQQILWHFNTIPKAEVYIFVNYQYASLLGMILTHHFSIPIIK